MYRLCADHVVRNPLPCESGRFQGWVKRIHCSYAMDRAEEEALPSCGMFLLLLWLKTQVARSRRLQKYVCCMRWGHWDSDLTTYLLSCKRAARNVIRMADGTSEPTTCRYSREIWDNVITAFTILLSFRLTDPSETLRVNWKTLPDSSFESAFAERCFSPFLDNSLFHEFYDRSNFLLRGSSSFRSCLVCHSEGGSGMLVGFLYGVAFGTGLRRRSPVNLLIRCYKVELCLMTNIV